MLRIGLTGGIGSGKSTVLKTLAALGAATIDADAISRATTAAGGAAMPAIAREFGPDFVGPDGAMNRDRMRAEVFSRPEARRQLEAIVHPLVSAAIRAQGEQAMAEGRRCLVIDIPLLVEGKYVQFGPWLAAAGFVAMAAGPDRLVRAMGLA